MTASMSLLGQLSAVQRAIRDQFQQGGSTLSVVIVFIVLVCIVWLAYYLTRRQQLADGVRPEADHQRLFEDLLAKLDLTATQQKRLESIAGKLHLEHPAILLLSPRIYDRCVARWRSAASVEPATDDDPLNPQSTRTIRGVLFPYTKAGFVDSRLLSEQGLDGPISVPAG